MFELTTSHKLNYPSRIIDWFQSRNNINFSPSYQRVGELWSLNAKQLLMDSIINGLDMPKFYMHYSISKYDPLNEAGKMFSIIDGKQRFEAIFGFIEDKFSLSEQFKYFGDESICIAGLTYSQINEKYPSIIIDFDQFELDIMHVITDEIERIEELFLRLNEGQNLVNAEKRYAISGYMNKSIRRIANEHNIFKYKVNFADKRYDYFDIVTKLVSLEYNNFSNSPFSRKTLDELLKQNKLEDDGNIKAIKKVEVGLDYMDFVFNESDLLLDSKNTLPLYYEFIKANKENKENMKHIRDFLVEFHSIRHNQIKVPSESRNLYLSEFNRLNQQGTTSLNSFTQRLNILKETFKIYLSNTDNFKIPDQLKSIQLEFDIDEDYMTEE